MAEEGVPAQDDPPDEFELYARKWAAEDRVLRATREAEELVRSEPDLALAVEKAVEGMEKAFRENDRDALWEAVADFLEARNEAVADE